MPRYFIRSLYELVVESEAPVSRDDASTALHLPRATAAFHLDRLAKEGLLDVSYRRLSGRSGPGSGRPTKLYSPAQGEVSVSLPQRHYELVARILAEAVDESMRTGAPVADALMEAADLLTAAAESAGLDPSRAVLDPAPGRCCVRILKATN